MAKPTPKTSHAGKGKVAPAQQPQKNNSKKKAPIPKVTGKPAPMAATASKQAQPPKKSPAAAAAAAQTAEDDDLKITFNEGFSFDEHEGVTIQSFIPTPSRLQASTLSKKSSLDDIIERKRKTLSFSDGDNESEIEEEVEVEAEASVDNEEQVEQDQDDSDDATEDEVSETTVKVHPDVANLLEGKAGSFHELALSRPLQRALTELGFIKPTDIQAVAIPVSLAGRDLVGGATTGSGKTAAFLLPILERLLYRSRSTAAIRVLILLPTRELACQCYDVAKRLTTYTDIQTCLLAGGLNYKQQQTDLKKRPDLLVATPGRLIDHIKNSPSFSLDCIEILVLDEADRMLEDGFKDELEEIIQSCPKARQTMLFSATMSASVDDLIRLSLKDPVQLFIDAADAMASNLAQEFIRIKEKREADRPAILVALAKHYFPHKCIIFMPTKHETHHMRVLFGLLGLSAAELHGNLNQAQRLESLDAFRAGRADFLLATDVAARGIDIAGVQSVINYALPASFKQYQHRVGRTARAGKAGRCVSLVTEADRKILKLAVKNARESVKQRVLPPALVDKVRASLEALQPAVEAILEEEKEQKQLDEAVMELTKAQNMITHADTIYARPKKTFIKKSQPLKKHKSHP